jgi:hypothetical protein
VITANREQRRQLERDNAKMPRELAPIPRDQWPDSSRSNASLVRVLRSRDFLVQEYAAPAPARVRLSVLRTTLDPKAGRWVDGITWDDLQRLKGECGYADCDAVEVFPSAVDVVKVANIRHLWVMAEPVAFAWRSA